MVDHLGNIVDGDEILFVIAKERHRKNIDIGGVVGTKMSNLGLELALADLDVPFTRTSVGDRFVLKEMLKRDWLLGGESSGHIICNDITSTGDGIVSALQALTAVINTERSLLDLRSQMRKLPQSMINVKLTNTFELESNQNVKSAVANIEEKLGTKGRVLLRPSGTEPVLRVMVEGEEGDTVATYAKELSEIVLQEVNGSD